MERYENKRDLLQENLKIIIAILDWNQTQLANLIGVTKATLSNWVKSNVLMPGMAYIAIMYRIRDRVKEIELSDAHLNMLLKLCGYEDLDNEYWMNLDYSYKPFK